MSGLMHSSKGGIKGSILLVLFLYIYFYNPFYFPTFGILGRGQYQQCIFLLWFGVILFYRSNVSYFKRFTSLFRTELYLFLFLVFWTFFHRLLGGNSQYFIESVKAVIELLFVPCFLIGFGRKQKLFTDNKCFFKYIFVVSAIASVFTLICLASPAFNTYVRDHILKLALFYDLSAMGFLEFRGFGIAEALTYSYGIIQGLCFALGVHYYKENKWYVFFMPFVLLSALLNARTGVVLAVVGMLPAFFERKNIKTAFLILIPIFILILFFEKFLTLFHLSDETMLWVSEFFEEINGIAESRDLASGHTTGAMFDTFIVLPTGFDWIVGTGQSLFGTNQSSDMGFILQLNYGGLIYCIPLYYLILHCFFRLQRTRNVSFSFLFLITFIIANLKGNFVPYSGGFRVLMLIYYFFVYSYYNPILKTT